MSTSTKTVTPEAIQKAIELRQQGKPWSAVIEATGFNGATLRPHMARSGFHAGNPTTNVKLTPASIVSARKAGMSWYAISLALDAPEAKLRKLAAEADPTIASGRTYVKADKPEPKTKKPATRKPAASK